MTNSRAAIKPHHYQFPMVSVAADVVCFTIDPNDGLKVALVRREWTSDAFPGFWALPGGFLRANEDRSIMDAARRELREETGAEATHLELVDVYSAIDRDPRPERIISVAFLATIPAHRLAPVPHTDVSEARWFAYDRALQLDLAFDHREIIGAARERLATKIRFGARDDEEPELLFAFLPPRFPIAAAEQMVADIQGGKRPDRANFRKWLGRYVVQTEVTEPARTRHAHLYERRHVRLPQVNEPPAPMSVVHDLARAGGVADVSRFVDDMRGAPPMAVAFLEQVLALYADHPGLSLKVTRVPDLRVISRQSGKKRVLLTFSWQSRNKAFACTALADPHALASGGFDGLKAWNGKPHRSAFRLGTQPDDMARLALALDAALTALGS